MAPSRILGFAADKKENLLVIRLQNPAQNIFIKSAEAKAVYDKPGLKKPMYVLSPEPAVFKILFQNGEEYAWTAQLAHDEGTGDVLMYDLSQIAQQ